MLENINYIFNELLGDSEYITQTGITIYYLNDKKYNLLVDALEEIKENGCNEELKKYISIAKNIKKRIERNRKEFTKAEIEVLEKIEYPFEKEIIELDNMF